MIPKKSLDSVLEKSIILTVTAPNDNAKSISVQCAPSDFGPLVVSAFYHLSYGHTYLMTLSCLNIHPSIKLTIKISAFIHSTHNNGDKVFIKVYLQGISARYICKVITPTPWLMLLLVLVKSPVNQKSC